MRTALWIIGVHGLSLLAYPLQLVSAAINAARGRGWRWPKYARWMVIQ